MTILEPNTQVRYKADPSISGWVISIIGDNVRVFIEGSARLIPIGELEPAVALTGNVAGPVQGCVDRAQARASGH